MIELILSPFDNQFGFVNVFMLKLKRNVVCITKFLGNINIQANFPDAYKFLWNEFIVPRNDPEFRILDSKFFQECSQDITSNQILSPTHLETIEAPFDYFSKGADENPPHCKRKPDLYLKVVFRRIQ